VLKWHVQANPHALMTNFVDIYFSVLDVPSVHGVLRSESFIVPLASVPNKFHTWFVGGQCRAAADAEPAAWKRVFGTMAAISSGNDYQDSYLRYSIPNPMTAFQHIKYLDETRRVITGSRGTVIITSSRIRFGTTDKI
jgi:hypothetical protein